MIIECYSDEIFDILDSFYFLYHNIDLIYSGYETGLKHFEAYLWELNE